MQTLRSLPAGLSPRPEAMTAGLPFDIRDTQWTVDLFNSMPDIYFYIKDTDSRWRACNDASLRLLGFESRERLFGLTEHDFFPMPIADAIRADDLEVIQGRTRIIGRVELIVGELGLPTWASTTKIPIITQAGEVAGLAGITRVIHELDEVPKFFRRFARAIDHIRANIGANIDVDELAKLSNLSSSQFRKRFRQQFGMSPNEFVLRTRLQVAARLLIGSDMPLANVALDCGFCDQSYFTKKFHKFFRLTPRKYRALALGGSIFGNNVGSHPPAVQAGEG